MIATVNAAQRSRYFKPARSPNSPVGHYKFNQRRYVPQNKSNQPPLICQLCDTEGHSAKTCHKVPKPKYTNCATTNGT